MRKELKDYIWQYDRDTKVLTAWKKGSIDSIVLDKVRWFSLLRFMIRAAYYLNIKKRKPKIVSP